MDVPVTGTESSPYPKAGTWQISTGYRWQKSDRHFVGSEYQEHRDDEASQVINKVHLLDLGVRYNWTQRTNFSLSLPYLIAERSNPIRDADRVVVDRGITHSNSVSDAVLTARRWVLDPDTCKNGNFSLGLGMKFPTGQSGHMDARRSLASGSLVSSLQPVDQSIQPGDGGLGFLVEATGFRRFGTRFVGYASGVYLFNPRETNDTDRGGNNPVTRFLSVGDQYLARVGVAGNWRRVTLSLGGRVEGVPSDDLLGGSSGFRRPGYAISLEPGVTIRAGRSAITAGLPIALYRNRTRSFADKLSGRHGDAAFADYILLLGFARLF